MLYVAFRLAMSPDTPVGELLNRIQRADIDIQKTKEYILRQVRTMGYDK